MQIHWLQHVPFEGLGFIETWAKLKSIACTRTAVYKNDQMPTLSNSDILIIMGGPMNIHDYKHYPWLKEEKKLIANAIDAGNKVLGICLGAQLIADVLGSTVYSGQNKEIGWYDLQLSSESNVSNILKDFPPSFKAFHWHGDTFDIPDNCAKLAESEACTNQAFEYEGRVVGLQFHLESTEESIEALTNHCHHEIVESKYIQPANEMLNQPELITQNHQLLALLLNNLLNS